MSRYGISHALASVICCLMATSIAIAQQGDREQLGQRQSDQNQTQQQEGLPEIPQALQDLDLSSDQQQAIQQAMQQHNQKLKQVWKSFNQQHARAIELESAWLAAVRDTVPENEQRQFDQQRMQDQELNHNSSETPQDRARQKKNRRDAQQSERRSRPTNNRQDEQASNSQASEPTDGQGQSAQSGEMKSPGFVVITIASPERYAQGTKQSDEQKQQCSQACGEYKQELKNVWKQLHQLHAELVHIEADRVQSIEQHLTEEQLTELRENREQPSQQTASFSQRRENR